MAKKHLTIAIQASISILFVVSFITTAELSFKLHPEDTLSLPLVSLVPSGNLLNDLTVSHDQQIVQARIPNVFGDNGKVAIPAENWPTDAKFVESASFGSTFVMMGMFETDCIAWIGRFDPEDSFKLLSNDMVVLARNNQVCKHLALDEAHIYYTTVSTMPDGLNLCKKSHTDIELIEICNQMNSPESFTKENMKVADPRIIAGKFNSPSTLSIFYVANSPVQEYKDKFMFFVGSEVQTVTIPIENFTIGKIEISNFTPEDQMIHILVLNQKPADQSEIFSISFRSGQLNKDALKFGMLKSNVRSFNESNGNLILYEAITSKRQNKFKVTVINMITQAEKEIIVDQEVTQARSFAIGDRYNAFELKANDETLLYILEIATGMLTKWKQDRLPLATFSHALSAEDNFTLGVLNYESRTVLVVRVNSNDRFVLAFDASRIKTPSQTEITLKVNEISINTIRVEFIAFTEKQITSNLKLYAPHDQRERVRLPVRGNALEFKSSRVEFFSPSKILGPSAFLNSCNIVRSSSSRNVIAYLCKEDKLVIIPIKSVLGKFNELDFEVFTIELDWYKTDQVTGIHLFNDDYMVVMTGEAELHFVRIDDVQANKSKGTRYSKMKDLFQSCRLFETQIICLKKEKLHVHTLEVSNGDISVTKNFSVLVKDSNPMAMIPFVSNNEQMLLELKPVKEDKSHILVSLNSSAAWVYFSGLQIPADLDAKILKINSKTLLVYAETATKPIMYLLKDQSLISLPINSFIKDFKSIIATATLSNAELFSIAYLTNQGKIRAAVYRASWSPLARLHSEVEIRDSNCVSLALSLAQNADNTVHLIAVCNPNSQIAKAQLESWTIRLDGAFLETNPLEASQLLTIGDESYKFSFEQPPERPAVVAKVNDIYLSRYAESDGSINQNLESSKSLILNGPVKKAKLISQNGNVKFSERVALHDQRTLIESIPFTTKRPRANVSAFKQSFRVVFDNFYSFNSKTEFSHSLSNCSQVTVAFVSGSHSDDFQALKLCSGKKDSHYILANFNDFSVGIPSNILDPFVKMNSAFFVLRNESAYLFVSHSDSRLMTIIKLGFDQSTNIWEVDEHTEFNVGLLAPESDCIESLHVFYSEESKQSWVIFHSQYAEHFGIVEFDTKLFRLSMDSAKQIPLNVGKTTQQLFSVKFVVEEEKLIALATTDRVAYALKFDHSKNWAIEITSTFDYSVHSSSATKMAISPNYVGFMAAAFDNAMRGELHVFKRGNSNQVEQIFYVVDKESIVSDNFFIMDFGFKYDQITKETNLMVAYIERVFKDPTSEARSLKTAEFTVGEMKLEVKTSGIAQTEPLEFTVTSLDNQFEKHNLHMTIQGVLPQTLLILILITLSIILVGLLLGLVAIYRGNKLMMQEINTQLIHPVNDGFRETTASGAL
jgi:hypothetical protein